MKAVEFYYIASKQPLKSYISKYFLFDPQMFSRMSSGFVSVKRSIHADRYPLKLASYVLSSTFLSAEKYELKIDYLFEQKNFLAHCDLKII